MYAFFTLFSSETWWKGSAGRPPDDMPYMLVTVWYTQKLKLGKLISLVVIAQKWSHILVNCLLFLLFSIGWCKLSSGYQSHRMSFNMSIGQHSRIYYRFLLQSFITINTCVTWNREFCLVSKLVNFLQNRNQKKPTKFVCFH